MSVQAQSVIDHLSTLPVAVRAEVLNYLVSSLEMDQEAGSAEPAAIAREWQSEIDRRVGQVLAGSAELIDGDEAINRLRSRFGS